MSESPARHQHAAQHHDHPAAAVERQCDVCVVGGSVAGLAAALQLGTQRRSVIVVDDGSPRNAPAAHLHGYLGFDGQAPSSLTAAGRAEVRSYGGEVLHGRVTTVRRDGDAQFRVEIAGGATVLARRVLAATGVADRLPSIPGLAEHWGRGVIHCPFCHGYDVRGRRIVHVVTDPAALHAATLFHHLTDRLTLLVDPGVESGDAAVGAGLQALRAAGATVVHGLAEGIVTDAKGQVAAVQTDDGRRIDADAVVVLPRFEPRIEPFAGLGLPLSAHATGGGSVVDIDDTGRTAIPGLFAAGTVTDPSQQLLSAAAHGSRVGAMIASGLAADDLHTAGGASANEADWDRRYSGDRLWSGNPNGSLVAETGGLPVGRALDVGAGEGGDALYLAERGWTVTASDISRRALDRIATEAARRGVTVRLLHADATAIDPFAESAFDLVTAHYASIPRSADRRGVRNLLSAVAPGGTLLVVSHDLADMRAGRPDEPAAAHDPDAYIRVEDVLAALSASPEWVIDVHETRPRPPGAASHHVADIVLRAHRRA